MGSPRIDNLGNNLLVNGGLHYWQRSTTGTVNLTGVGNTSVKCTDKFGLYSNRVTNNQNFSVSRITDTPTVEQVGVPLQFSMRVTSNLAHAYTGEDRVNAFYQYIEGSLLHSVADNDKLYLSFWFKAANDIPVATIAVNHSSSGTTMDRSMILTFSYTAASGWVKVEKEIQLPGASTHRGTGYGLVINFLPIAGSSSAVNTPSINTWQTGMYLAGSSATNWASNGAYVQFAGLQLSKYKSAFSLAGGNLPTEFWLCQRYYEKSYEPDTLPGTITTTGSVWFVAHNSMLYLGGQIYFNTRKRAIPLIVGYSPTTGIVNEAAVDGNARAVNVNGNNTSHSTRIIINNINSTVNQFMTVHYTADADF